VGGAIPACLRNANKQALTLATSNWEILVVWLEMSPAGVGYAVKRGEAIAHEISPFLD